MSNKLKKYLLPLLLAAMPTAYFKEGEGKGATEKINLSISLQRKNANLHAIERTGQPLPQLVAMPWHWREGLLYPQRTEMSQELRMVPEQVELTLLGDRPSRVLLVL